MKLRLVGFIICWIVGNSAIVSARNEHEYTDISTPEELEAMWCMEFVDCYWPPDELVVCMTSTSYEQFLDILHKGLFQEGDLQTGLASLDTLIQRTGVIHLEYVAFGCFGVQFTADEADFDLPSMALLYMQNEHVWIADANGQAPLAETPNDTLYI